VPDATAFLAKGDRMDDPLMILVAGPYRSGTNDDPALIEANVAAMTQAALRLFRLGHLPVMGEWFALPLIEAAGSTGVGDDVFNEIFHPIAESVLERCDACLRIGGPSQGADRMVEVARGLGKAVFDDIAAIPATTSPSRTIRGPDWASEPLVPPES
jgi:hypothetical protein